MALAAEARLLEQADDLLVHVVDLLAPVGNVHRLSLRSRDVLDTCLLGTITAKPPR